MGKPQAGHNSNARTEDIQALAVRYADADEKSQELNDERSEIREKIKDMGLDTKAWQDEIKRAKGSLKKREGYDESANEIRSAIGQMDMEDLWSHVIERADRLEKEREEKRAAKDKEKKSADEYKAAADRKPKNPKIITGKDAASGEKVEDIGAAQAAAYQKAHGTA